MAARSAPGSALALALSLLPLLPLLAVVPTLVPPDSSVQSEAAAHGYNNALAYQVAVAWLAAVALWWSRRGSDTPDVVAPAAGQLPASRRWLERAAVAGALTLALWPWTLARYGPYIEDAIFLNAGQRMVSGQVPFRDFEFLYGPLMIVPLGGWLRLTGVSLESYYGFLLLTELAGWLAVVVFLQRVAPDARDRYLAFAIAALLLMNAALGVNYAPLRRLLPLAALLIVTYRPFGWRTTAAAGAVLGVALAYSHETAIAAGAGAAALYVVLAWRDGLARLVAPALAFGVCAVAVWAIVALGTLGEAFGDYLREARDLAARFSAGEAAFRFYWTVNAVAAFAIVTGGVAVVARAFGPAGPKGATAWGDRFLLGALVATVVQLKSGLNRADVWHLAGGILPLVAAFAVPLPRRVVGLSAGERGAAMAAIIVLGLTLLIGQAPLLAYVARGWVQGWTASAGTASPSIDAEAPVLELRRAVPRADRVALARYFAAPERRGATVYFYGTLWGLGASIGVPKRDPNNDDFLYSDERGRRAAAWLAREQVPYVVMSVGAEARLFERPGPEGAEEFARRLQPSLVKDVASWLSSVHFTAVETEMPLQDARWRRLLGDQIRAHYGRDTVIGEFVVLRRTSR